MMEKGDKIRRKDNHSVTACVLDVKITYVLRYGFGGEVLIFNGMGREWVPMKQWEVIKE